MTNDVKKMILRYGKNKQYLGARTISAEVICQGCGKTIKSDDIPADTQYVLTKRKTLYVFHRKCYQKVWDSKIRM